MSIRRRLLRFGALIALSGLLVAGASAATGGVSWGSAIAVPGWPYSTWDATMDSVSCWSARNCVVGGSSYHHLSGTYAFLAEEVDGTWSYAATVRSLTRVVSVSCRGSGYCLAGAVSPLAYNDANAFVVERKNGTWGTPTVVPGTEPPAGGSSTHFAAVTSVSCGSAGNCVVAGSFHNAANNPSDVQQGFVATETGGVWHAAMKVPGLAALSGGMASSVDSVSCATAGNCGAGGTANGQAFVVSEKNGVWGKAIFVPGIRAVNLGGDARVRSLSCATSGNCAAGGYYTNFGDWQPFLVSEKNGVWLKATRLRSGGHLVYGGVVNAVSCRSAGECSAGGSYSVGATAQAFVVNGASWGWGQAITVPGSKALNTGGSARVITLSCASAGNCAAGGSFTDSVKHGFLVRETNGNWGNAVPVPGLAALDASPYGDIVGTVVSSISCAGARCAAGGTYGNADMPFVTAP